MKKFNLKLKRLSVLLSVLIIAQSCQVYRTSSISLDEASKIDEKVKVQTIEGKRIEFKKIDKEEDFYYGLKRKKGELVKIPLNHEDIVGIFPKHKTASIVNTILLSLVVVGLVTVIISSIVNIDLAESQATNPK